MKRFEPIAYLLLFFCKPLFANGWEKFSANAFDDSLCFKSAESSHNLGIVRNCIALKESKNSQLWLMRQDIKYEKGNIANLVGIEVKIPSDPKIQKPVATYFEFERELFEKSGILKVQPFKVPCLTCHPSGPRAIRPDVNDDIYPQAKINFAKLDLWNKKISALKQVDFAQAAPDQGRLELIKPALQIPLNIAACNECHGSSGVRQPLTSLHLNSISFLTENQQAMPPVDHIFSEHDRECLQNWLKKPFAGECGNKGNPHSQGLNSFVKVKVQTTFHDFEIDPLPARLRKNCSKKECSITGRVDLANLNSGISARNQTIFRILKIDQFPFVEVAAKVPNQRDFRGEIEVILTINGISNNQVISTSCNSNLDQCDLYETGVDLKRWGIAVPNVFGIGLTKLLVTGILHNEKNAEIPNQTRI